MLEAPEVRHLHAHFAHGTTTVTWLAAHDRRPPFSFTGHARDIYAPQLNPHGLLRRKLLAASFAVTCTEANVEHLRRIAPEARVHLVYHGLNADFARLLGEPPPPPAAQRPRCACSASGGWSRRRASTCSSTRARVLRRRGVAVRGA